MGAKVWTIRCATLTDATAVREAAEAAFARYVEAIGRPPAPMVADFVAEIARARVHVLSNTENQVAGYIAFHVEDGVMHLDNLAVHPAYAGQGLGKRLISYCEDEARRLEVDRIALFTNVKMVENLAMYSHLGFAEVGRRREDGFDRVYYEKSLS